MHRVCAVGVVVGTLLSTAAVAAPTDPPPAAVWVGVTSADVCAGALTVAFGTETLAGHTWVPLADRGAARLDIHAHDGWVTVPATSGGEHRLRWVPGRGATWDLVRVTYAGFTSSARPSGVCAP